MLDTLSTRLQTIFDRLGGRGRLTEDNVQEALREIRVALLEADVNFKVVRGFVESVRARAIGQDVLRSLTPAQQVVKIVHDELVELLGGSGHRLAPAPHPPTVIMLIGLQGSGKTTTAAKLARHYTKQGQHPILAAADVYRPAAQDQLRVLGRDLGVPVVGGAGEAPLAICRQAREEAAARGLTPLILDTAGRLHIDAPMLEELKAIRKEIQPHHVLLVVDAMTGQDAVNIADQFNRVVGIDAVVLTKLDGDSRGGAALSVRSVTGRPIAFVGTGEKADALEPFHPDRLASRILGMGDVLSLVEKAQATVDQETAQALARKLREDAFTLDDFREQLRQVRQMGPLDQILGMLPFGKALRGAPQDLAAESADLGRFDAIISSMTPGERRQPETINGSRRQRIARGSGTSVQDVNRLLKQYAQLRKMMKQLKGMEGKLPRMKGLPGFPTPRG
ncbi:MAG: signal recognition particle protein [Candidatus Rokubacteria bacterium RIFCSPLOWO2_02_FULL_72_37]|nr:MAG: signal recognition particle protein [Candidatus Rokubacteria bacterium RIFCSPLOWO2_02_FULL_72_37]